LRELSDHFYVRPYHRRWRISDGGIGVFLPAAELTRAIAWAEKLAAEVGGSGQVHVMTGCGPRRRTKRGSK
jgi:hypothetical protein